MKQISSKEAIKILERNGWYVDRQSGSHVTLKHPANPFLITISHPKKTMSPGQIRDAERKSGLRF